MISMPLAVNYAPKKNMKKSVKGTFFFRTNRGLVRLHNEDVASVVVNARNDVLLVVADGMGGYKKGDFAAKIAVDTMVKMFQDRTCFLSTGVITRFLRKAVHEANRVIYEESRKDPDSENMGTTLVAVVIHRDKLVVLNIGDSRAYKFDKGKLTQISEDQSYVQYLIRTKRLKLEDAKNHPKRHVLMNALGNLPSCNMEIMKFPYNSEKILLCSDGLYNSLDILDIETVLKTQDTSEQKGLMLISLANHNGGEDNVAVALWEPLHD